MMKNTSFEKRIFQIDSTGKFNDLAVEIFRYQYENNRVYREFADHLKIRIQKVESPEQIPFLPIGFFKTQKVLTGQDQTHAHFESSSATGTGISRHFYSDLNIYHQSLMQGFRHFYGDPSQYCILALLPSYLERSGSSLVYMVQQLIDASGHTGSGFYLHNLDDLAEKLQILDRQGEKNLLIGVSFALLDLVGKRQFDLKNTIVMETGGMKGRRRELVREELHAELCRGFGVKQIHSEYGMTELFSQAYSKGGGKFFTPPWMKVLIRDTNDPLTCQGHGKTGGINVIDLANLHSCCFIATQDLGRNHADGSFEVLGRFDHSDVRGCSLLVA